MSLMVMVRVRVKAGKTCCSRSMLYGVLVLVVCTSMCIRGLEVPRFAN